MKDDLNELLAERVYWDVVARAEAEKRFSSRVVEIFYYGMQPEAFDFVAIRETGIPLPTSRDSDYRRTLAIGTTGSGKTTLLRQLIGTDPESERFPSTSTAKTTVHDIEVLLDDGAYRAVVTFFPMEEVREHLNECISAAVLAAFRRENDHEILRRLLMHVNQRFRFNYVLGNGPAIDHGSSDDEEDEDELQTSFGDSAHGASALAIDLDTTNILLASAIVKIQEVAQRHGDRLKDELGIVEEKDQRVLDELFEEELDTRLREDEAFHTLADALMDEIERRFELLPVGTMRKSKQGWPQSWSWETDDRASFLDTVGSFSSNYAPRFGHLLTPLVNGVRVAGPFLPQWNGGKQPKLVLMDGEGLGHTPKSAAAISTSLTRRIDSADAVILVDSATQPMQAAPVAAMRDLVSSGNSPKLLFVFTHFDEVKGDNLPTYSAKEEHVLQSAENVLAAIGEELGPYAERALRTRLKISRFFVGGIDNVVNPIGKKADKRTIGQLRSLLEAIDNIIERPVPAEAVPVYDRMNLVLAVRDAAGSFHNAWWPRLGLESAPGVHKEHWTRVKALTRRLASPGWVDEYDTLKPVADLRSQLQSRLYVLIQNPLRWEPTEPSEEEKRQQKFNALAENLSRRILELSSRRLRVDRLGEWQEAYNVAGRGSSFVRASMVGERIYEKAAPIPDVTPSPDRNNFLHEVAAAVEATCEEVRAKLL